MGRHVALGLSPHHQPSLPSSPRTLVNWSVSDMATTSRYTARTPAGGRRAISVVTSIAGSALSASKSNASPGCRTATVEDGAAAVVNPGRLALIASGLPRTTIF